MYNFFFCLSRVRFSPVDITAFASVVIIANGVTVVLVVGISCLTRVPFTFRYQKRKEKENYPGNVQKLFEHTIVHEGGIFHEACVSFIFVILSSTKYAQTHINTRAHTHTNT